MIWGTLLAAFARPAAASSFAAFCLNVGDTTVGSVSFEKGSVLTPGCQGTVGLADRTTGGTWSSIPNPLTQALTTGYLKLNGTDTTSAYASLEQGTLRGYAAGGVTGTSLSEYSDGVTFNFTGPLTIHFHLDGTQTSLGTVGGCCSYSDQVLFQLAGATIEYDTSSSAGIQTLQNNAWTSFNWANVTSSGFDFTGTLNVTSGLRSYVQGGLSLSSTDYLQDFTNTARLTWDLPQGGTYTSDSGVFLTQSPSVPEPSTWSCLGAALAALALLWRRRLARGR